MESGETYLGLNNYQKAAEEYGEAMTLARSLKRADEQEESDRYIKLAEQIMLADDALGGGEYQKAQELYLAAREMSVETGNTGLQYIDGQLDRVLRFVKVFDLIAQGERKQEYGNLEGAIALYKEAKEMAEALYFSEGKAEALKLQMEAEEALDQQKMDEAAKLQEQINEEVASMAVENEQKSNDQQSAMEIENQGNALLAQGFYEEAITFYQTAQAMYVKLEMEELAEEIEPKITVARAGMEALRKAAELEQEAQASTEEITAVQPEETGETSQQDPPAE